MKYLLNNSTWLRQKYQIEKLSTYDLGRMLRVDPKTVYARLRKYGIPTRPRGQNLKGADNYMASPGVVNPFSGRKHTEDTKLQISIKASVPKPYLRGEANGMYGRCGASHPNYRGGTTPERQAVYSSREWGSASRAAKRRDMYKCRRCGSPKKGYRSLHLHHIKAWASYPELRCIVSNLILLCKTCHAWVHSVCNREKEYL